MDEGLSEIFARLKGRLRKYEGPLEARIDRPGRYELWSVKDIVIEGRERKEVYFAGLIVQSDYVGLYYMPVYIDAELKKVFPPELVKLLKGKSCFHIRALTPPLERQIAEALEQGYRLYKKRGWIRRGFGQPSGSER